MIAPSLPADCDWHVHTTLSDGTAAPDEALRLAAARGLRSIAITDHDCLDAHLQAPLAVLATQLAVQLVVGAEIDCSIDHQETEILAYHFDPHHPGLSRCLRDVQTQRWERFRFYCYGMAAKGHPIDAEAVIHCGTKVPIKVHLYRALEAAGVYRPDAYKPFKAELDDLGAAPPVDKPALEEAVALVRRCRPIELTVVGGVDPNGPLRRMIAELGIAPAVSFTGALDPVQFNCQYARASLAVVPSVYEGFGLPAGEAMACGVPVISTTGGALPEVVGTAGVLVPPADAAALARAIIELLDHPQRRQDLGQAGYCRVQQYFTWRRAAAKTLTAYTEVLGEQH